MQVVLIHRKFAHFAHANDCPNARVRSLSFTTTCLLNRDAENYRKYRPNIDDRYYRVYRQVFN